MSSSLSKLPLTCVSVLSLLTLAACGGGSGGSSSGSNGSSGSAPDQTAPNISFNPATITTESELSVDVTLTSSDNVGVTSGPTVTCVSNTGTGGTGTFSDNVFIAPYVIFTVSNTCTATVSDAAGNQSEAVLEIIIEPAPDFARVSDTIITEPVLGLINIPTDPNPGFGNTSPDTLVGLTRSGSSSAVSSFAANAVSDLGEFDDAVVTTQSTLGTIGVAPLDSFFANVSGVPDNSPDFIFLDEVNDELVALPLNSDNTFGLPLTRSVPNACGAGRGADITISAPGTGRSDTTRTDILVGTTNGLFLVGAGDANEGDGPGLSDPTPIVTEGNFCKLFVGEFINDTLYATYDAATGFVSAYQGSSGDAGSYELDFSSDISGEVPAGAEHLLTKGFVDGFGLDSIYNVFTNPEGGTILVKNATGGTQPVTVYELDIDAPTDIAVFESSGRERVVLVSPMSEMAAYIPNADSISNDIEYFEIGLGFDQMDYSDDAFALTFASSTMSNVIVRRRF